MAPLLTRVGQAFGFGAPSGGGATSGTATGGAKVTPGDGYNYHVFTKDTPAPNLSLVVSGATIPGCAILLIGGGGSGGGGWYQGGTWGGAGGGAGCVAVNPNVALVAGTYPVSVGEGGAAGAGGRTTGIPEPAPDRGHWPGAAGGQSYWNGPADNGDVVKAGGGTPGAASGQAPQAPSNRKYASNDSTLGGSTGGGGSRSPSPPIMSSGEVGGDGEVAGWTYYGERGGPASPTGDNNACSAGGGGAGGTGFAPPSNNVGGKGGAAQALPAFPAPAIAPAPTVDNPAAFILAVGPSGYYGGGGGGAAQNQGSTRGYGGNQPTSVNTGGGGCGGGSSSVGNEAKYNENQLGPNSTDVLGYVPGTGGGGGGQSGNGGYQQGPSGADGICVVRYPV